MNHPGLPLRFIAGSFHCMSAAEIIEQIKTLPREEQRRVFDFVMKADVTAGETRVRFATDAQARVASTAVIQQYPEVFRRLAE